MVFLFNFRADRARQLTSALGEPEFSGFDRGGCGLARLLTLSDYGLGPWIEGVVLPPYSPGGDAGRDFERGGHSPVSLQRE